MQFATFEDLVTGFQSLNVPVQKANCQEEGLVGAAVFEGDSKDFTHPVNHFRSVAGSYLMSLKVIRFQLGLSLESPQIALDLFAIVCYQVVSDMLYLSLFQVSFNAALADAGRLAGTHARLI